MNRANRMDICVCACVCVCVCVCVCIQRERRGDVSKELVHMTVEDEKPHDLQSASWRTREASV